ncbi:MAG: major capsid protein [Magnetococcales bacterium]|nr:major capsid protein [Magnetococcales bacterium]
MTDAFSPNPFSLVEMVQAINLIPSAYGRINGLSIFRDQGVTTTTVGFEELKGVLRLLRFQERGARGAEHQYDKRKIRTFSIPHIPLPASLLAEKFQNVRGFGLDAGPDPFTKAVMDLLALLRNNHAITLEWLRMGALKGVILDADSSITHDLFDEFQIGDSDPTDFEESKVGKRLQLNFELDSDATDVRAKCMMVKRHIEQNLQGDTMSDVRVLVSAAFYDALTAHAKVKEAFSGWQAAQDRLAGDMRKGFTFGGITFEEYSAFATDPSGDIVPFIESGYGHAFPVGTSQTFTTFYAPADYKETVNTPGLPLYAKMEEMRFGKGWDIETQSNPLPICSRPGVLVELIAE